MTDIVNEYFGPKAVKRISYTAVALIAYAFIMFSLAIWIAPDNWWLGSGTEKGLPDMQTAFTAIFGQSNWIIVASLVAFLVSQVVDVLVFHRIKRITGEKHIWLRATGSTLVSQLIDSYIVLFIAFKIGSNWSWGRVLAIGMMNYTYKFIVAIVLTPVIYIAEKQIERYVGADKAKQMKAAAMGKEEFANIPTAG